MHEAIEINLHMHQLNMVIHIYIPFHETWLTKTLIMAKLQILNQCKNNISCVVVHSANILCVTMPG